MVASHEPVAPIAGGGVLWLIEIADHQAGVAAVDGEDALLRLGPRLIQQGDTAAGLGKAGGAGGRGAGRAAGEVGGAFRHAQRLMQVSAGDGLPLLAQRGRQAFAGSQAVAQSGQGGQGCAQHLADDARCCGKDGGIEPLHQQRQVGGRDASAGDQRSRAIHPRVQQAGAQGEGPVERARVQQAVGGQQPLPPLIHHAPRPDRAVSMGDRQGGARGAGGENHIGQPVRVAHLPRAGRQPLHRQHLGRADHRGGVVGQGHAVLGHDQRGGDAGGKPRRLGRGQGGGGRHRHQTGGDGAQKQHRKGRRIAQPHQHPVARLQAPRQKAGAAAANRRLQPPIAPPLGALRAQDLQGRLVGLRPGLQQRMGRQIERRGAGRKTGHSPCLSPHRDRCKTARF